jgi:hypothetical protein
MRAHGAAIVPGNARESLAVARILSGDAEDVMPPPDSGKHALSPAERDLIVRWIEDGARYEPHWAFVPPQPPSPPAAADGAARAPIDAFLAAGLARSGLAPGPAADRAMQCRRVHLDLTGLPPTPEELDAFLADGRPDAYVHLVDRLLNEEPYRSRYAERMAVPWLDVARYADTSGIHMDAGRQMWPWRDWVLAAFRDNMPYDRFVVEQVAGDLLPGAGTSKRS